MINVLYEDQYLIAVAKKAKKLTISSEKEKINTLYHDVSNYVKAKNKNNKIFIIHRLDYDTSGIVLFAKNQKTKDIMQKNWNDVKRNYIAVVTGIVKKNHDIIKTYLKETKTLFTYSSNKNGKLALTEYTVLKRSKNHTLLNINLITGRKNQIRVHLKDIGNPIVGDSKYGNEKEKRLFLHASILELFNPITRKNMSFTSKVPSIFNSKVK